MSVTDLTYIAQDVEIDRGCDELEWEDYRYLAEEILLAKESNVDEPARQWCLIAANNINWRNDSGIALHEMYAGNEEDIEFFWSRIAGINADWTIKIKEIPDYPKEFDCVVYSHDTPTGGSRKVRFLTSAELLNKVLLDGSRGRLDELKAAFECSSKQQLIYKLDHELRVEEVREYL